jgi:hypothetical protein
MVNNSHQYQQREQSSLNSDGQQFHKYQQREQSSLNSDGQQFTPIISGIVDHHCFEVIVRFVDIGDIIDHHCLEMIVLFADIGVNY